MADRYFGHPCPCQSLPTLAHNLGIDPMSRPLPTFLRQISNPGDLWRRREWRYLLVGGFNTLVGYGLGVGLYLMLSPQLHILIIGVIANILAITVSFTNFKYLVFRTQGHWWFEYARSFAVYGGTALLGIILLWFLVDGLAMPIWFAQGLAILLTAIVSYLGHSRFTFRRSPSGAIDG